MGVNGGEGESLPHEAAGPVASRPQGRRGAGRASLAVLAYPFTRRRSPSPGRPAVSSSARVADSGVGSGITPGRDAHPGNVVQPEHCGGPSMLPAPWLQYKIRRFARSRTYTLNWLLFSPADDPPISKSVETGAVWVRAGAVNATMAPATAAATSAEMIVRCTACALPL